MQNETASKRATLANGKTDNLASESYPTLHTFHTSHIAVLASDIGMVCGLCELCSQRAWLGLSLCAMAAIDGKDLDPAPQNSPNANVDRNRKIYICECVRRSDMVSPSYCSLGQAGLNGKQDAPFNWQSSYLHTYARTNCGTHFQEPSTNARLHALFIIACCAPRLLGSILAKTRQFCAASRALTLNSCVMW